MSGLEQVVEERSLTLGVLAVAPKLVVQRSQATISEASEALKREPLKPLTMYSGQDTVEYLRAEFPSECWSFQLVATTVTDSLDQFFVRLLPQDPRIEHVYWFSDEETLKVWTVIPEPDFDLEEPIYKAQMAFMARFDEYECDFNVIYRCGKSIEDIHPQGAYLVH